MESALTFSTTTSWSHKAESDEVNDMYDDRPGAAGYN
jgi:hypothetical protein